MALKAIALLGVLAHLAVAHSPEARSPDADYGFANTTECKEVTYYELSHGRMMAAPTQYVTGYGDIIGAKRGYHPECFTSMNITNVILGNATAESNATTEAMQIKEFLNYSGQGTGTDKRDLDKRSWLLGPITLFMKAIGFAGAIMSGLCQIFTSLPQYEGTAWNQNNCIIGGVFVVSAVVFTAAVAASGNAAVAWSASVQTYNAIYLAVSGASEAATVSYLLSVFAKRSDTDIPEMFRNIAEAHRNTGIAKNITLGGIALTQGINLHHPSGYEYNVMDLMGADHLNPLTRNVTVMNQTVQANWWIKPHPYKTNSSILIHRLPSSQLRSLNNNITKRQQEVGYNDLPYDGPNNLVDQYGGLDSVDDGGSDPDLIFGMDFYDGPAEIGDAVGEPDGGSGEATQLDADMSAYIIDNQSWENCVCFKDNGNWAGTGSMQYTWDQTYNGYSACYAADCDGA
jgi:hypothetical protein